jgi:serine protease Do
VNLRGEVIGINTAIFSRSGGNQGVGLAIPIDMARDVMQRLIADGKVVRGWLGVSIQELNPDLAASFNYKKSGGALIGDVMKNSTAEKSGLQNGDIVTELNGKEITNIAAFRRQIAQAKPGAKVTLDIWRDNKSQKMDVEIGEAPAVASSTGDNETVQPQALDQLGIELADPGSPSARGMNLPANTKGALIVSVEQDSLAERAGLRVGDLVINVAGKAVQNAEEAKAELARQDLKAVVRVRVRSGESVRFVFLKND